MHQGHSYAVQSAALYVALIPFVLLFTLMIGARYFESLRRARKPVPRRPAIIAIAPMAPARRFISAVD
jgi:hypothetical protein